MAVDDVPASKKIFTGRHETWEPHGFLEDMRSLQRQRDWTDSDLLHVLIDAIDYEPGDGTRREILSTIDIITEQNDG